MYDPTTGHTILFQQQQLPHLDKFLRLHPVEIHPGGQRHPSVTAAVPEHRLEARLLTLVDQGAHFLAEHIVDHQLDPADLRKVVADGGGGIERVGIILMQGKRHWQGDLVFDANGTGIHPGGDDRGRIQSLDIAGVIFCDAVEAISVAQFPSINFSRNRGIAQPQFEGAAVLRHIDIIAGQAGARAVVLAGPAHLEGGGDDLRRQRVHRAERRTGVDGVEDRFGDDRLIDIEDDLRRSVDDVARLGGGMRRNGVADKALAAPGGVIHRQEAGKGTGRRLAGHRIDRGEIPEDGAGIQIDPGGDIHENPQRIDHIQPLGIISAVRWRSEDKIAEPEAAQTEAARIDGAVQRLGNVHRQRRGSRQGRVILEADGVGQRLRAGDPVLVAKAGGTGDIIGVEGGSQNIAYNF